MFKWYIKIIVYELFLSFLYAVKNALPVMPCTIELVDDILVNIDEPQEYASRKALIYFMHIRKQFLFSMPFYKVPLNNNN